MHSLFSASAFGAGRRWGDCEAASSFDSGTDEKLPLIWNRFMLLIRGCCVFTGVRPRPGGYGFADAFTGVRPMPGGYCLADVGGLKPVGGLKAGTGAAGPVGGLKPGTDAAGTCTNDALGEPKLNERNIGCI